MNRKIIFAAIGAAAFSVILIIAAVIVQSRNSFKDEFDLYFLNESGSTLVSEKHIIKYHDQYDLQVKIIEKLIKGPDNGKNKPVLRKKTKLNSLDLTDPTQIIADFNYRFISGDTSRDVLSTYAVVKTLCGLDGIDYVKVTVEKNDIPTAEGKPIGFLSDSDINLLTDTNTSETVEATLYFADRQTKQLVPEKRNIKVSDQLPLAHYVINELIKGAQEEGHGNVLSADTPLISVNITDSICFVNFEKSFISKNSGSENKELLAVYSVVNSLTELNNIARVQFLIDGKKMDMFGKIPFDGLFERNISVTE